MRRVFILLSTKALPCARHCLRTLSAQSAEPVRLDLVANTREKQRLLLARIVQYTVPGRDKTLFLTLGKLPEALGVLEYAARRLARRPAGLIEYK